MNLRLGHSPLGLVLFVVTITATHGYFVYPSADQQTLYDYFLQGTNNQPLTSGSFSTSSWKPLDEASVEYNLVKPENHLPSSFSYGWAAANQRPRLDLIDTQKLVAYLKQLQDEDEADGGGGGSGSADVAAVNDLNSHLSPTDPLANTISGPINDPADFEAVLSQLTNAINHEIPNSSNRSAVLDDLLSVYLGSLMQQLKQQSEDANNNELDSIFDDNGASTTTTEAELLSRASTPSASRYGGGEYIDHPLALIGHQYVQGGAGEGRQLLGPDGTFENVQVIKSDHAVPTYCDPPNPCPIGYSAEDGCLEKFVNSASFSREYQVKQQCSCDNEHSLFNCASPVSTMKDQIYSTQGDDGQVSDGEGDGRPTSHSLAIAEEQEAKQAAANRLDTLARTIQNRFGGLAGVRSLVEKHQKAMGQQPDAEHYTIEKKGSHFGPEFNY